MALIGHWPLNGNTNDISGMDRPMINYGATLDSGKIGQSYLTNGTSTYLTSPDIIPNTKNYFSLAFWLYPVSIASDRLIGVTSYGYDHSFRYDGTNKRIGIELCETNNTNQRTLYTNSNTVLLGQWYHITVLMNDLNIKIYINGILSLESLQTIPVAPWTGIWAWGQRGNATLYSNVKLNDIRVYNHILTDLEIQEIARAKILHYTFDDMQEPTTNISGGIQPTWGAWGTPVITGSSSYTTLPNGKQAVYMTSTYSGSGGVKWRATNNDNLIAVTPSTAYTMSAFIKYTNNNPSANLFYLRQYRADGSQIQENGWYSTAFRKTLADGWYYAWRTVTLHAECVNVRLESYEYSTNEIWMYNFQFEKKDHPTEYTESSRTGQVKDYSGFFNHSDPLTELNTPTWTPEAKIGTGGYTFVPISNDSIFNENNAKMIDNTLVKLPYDQYTVSFWTYRTASGLQGGSYMRFGNYNAGLGFDTYDEVFNILAGQGAGVSLASVSLSTTLNQWEHTTLVFNRFSPNILKKYTNGVFVANGTQNLSYINNNNTPTGYPFKIGISFAGGVARSYNGIIDDVRIYATALSDKDIKDLYEARAEIEQSGVLYARDFLSNTEETMNLHGDPNMTKQYTENSVVSKSNWGVDGTLFARKNIAPEAEFGSLMLEMNITSCSSGGLYTDLGGSGREYTLVEGKTYTRSWWVKCSDTRTISGHICSSNRGLDNLYIVGPDITVSPTWKKFSHTFTVATGQGGLYHTRHIIYNSIFSVWIANFQIEEKDHPTPFVSTYRPASQLPSTLKFGADEIHETGTANFEDFSTVGISSGLKAYWPLNYNAKDYSGNSLDLAAMNSPIINGESCYLNGTNQYLTIANNALLTPGTSDFSIVVSFLAPDLWNGEVFGKRDAGAGNLEMQIGSGGQIYTYLANVNGSGYSSTTYYTQGVWQHYVLTRTKDNFKVYVNKVLGSNVTLPSDFDISPISSFDIGRDPGNAGEFFKGYIKDFKFFDRALTEEEIAIEYNTVFKNEIQIHKSGVLYAKDLIQY